MYGIASVLSSGLSQPLDALYMPLRHMQLGMQNSGSLKATVCTASC